MEIADKEWRIRNLYHIINKAGQKVLFQPNFAQDQVRRATVNRKLVLKCRQIGMTTGELLNLFDSTVFNENVNSVIVAHKEDVIEKVFRIVHTAYNSMDERIKPTLDRGGGSRYAMYFPEINSRVSVALSSVGETVHHLHITEAALIKDPRRIKETLETVPINTGTVTMESTARGLGNLFADIYNEPDDIHERFFFPWYLFSEYQMPAPKEMALTDDEQKLCAYAKKAHKISITKEQIQFRRFKKATLRDTTNEDGERVTFEQEYPEDPVSCFLASGSKVLDLFIVNELLKTAPQPIEAKDFVRVYKAPSTKGIYVIGADTSEGIGKDPSVAVMIDIAQPSGPEVVAVLSGQFKPHDFAHRLMALTKKYMFHGKHPPLLAVERNNHGHAVLLELNENIGHPNLYTHTDDKLGWLTNMVSRPVMMNTFINTVENKSVRINDRQILLECLTLIDNGGKIEAEIGKKDDHVVAAAIAIQMYLKLGNAGVYSNLSDLIRI